MASPNRVVHIFLLAMLLGVAGCGSDPLPDNERLLAIFADGRTGIWVSGHGEVLRLLGDETLGDALVQRMDVRVNDQLNIVVRHSLIHSERVPAGPGDIIAFQGRYEWDGRGGAISLTHHDEGQPGGGGWIRHNRVQYD